MLTCFGGPQVDNLPNPESKKIRPNRKPGPESVWVPIPDSGFGVWALRKSDFYRLGTIGG